MTSDVVTVCEEVNLCVLRHSLSFLRCDRLAEKIRMCPEQDLKSRKGFLKALEVYVHRQIAAEGHQNPCLFWSVMGRCLLGPVSCRLPGCR